MRFPLFHELLQLWPRLPAGDWQTGVACPCPGDTLGVSPAPAGPEQSPESRGSQGGPELQGALFPEGSGDLTGLNMSAQPSLHTEDSIRKL